MSLLNFPCPTCGAMVSTVDLAPGVMPFCSGCGRTFPQVEPSTLSSCDTTPRASAAGGIVVSVLILMVMLVGVAFFFASFHAASMRVEVDRETASEEARIANTGQAERMAVQLEDEDFDKSIAAWHALYQCDRVDRKGTFAVLDRLFARTASRNALWNLANGFQEFYEQPGETSIARELVARQRNQEQVELLCQSLESCPESVTREVDAAKGAEGWVKSARILDAVAAQVDRPLASQRIREALEKVRSKIPAEQR